MDGEDTEGSFKIFLILKHLGHITISSGLLYL